jgi:hypothetical protein
MNYINLTFVNNNLCFACDTPVYNVILTCPAGASNVTNGMVEQFFDLSKASKDVQVSVCYSEYKKTDAIKLSILHRTCSHMNTKNKEEILSFILKGLEDLRGLFRTKSGPQSLTYDCFQDKYHFLRAMFNTLTAAFNLPLTEKGQKVLKFFEYTNPILTEVSHKINDDIKTRNNYNSYYHRAVDLYSCQAYNNHHYLLPSIVCGTCAFQILYDERAEKARSRGLARKILQIGRTDPSYRTILEDVLFKNPVNEHRIELIKSSIIMEALLKK